VNYVISGGPTGQQTVNGNSVTYTLTPGQSLHIQPCTR